MLKRYTGCLVTCGVLLVGCQNVTSPAAGAVVASVALTTSAVTVEPPGTVILTATALDNVGRTVAGRDVTWTSSLPSIATVDHNGVLTAIAAGLVTVTATIDGKSASVTIRVGPPPGPPPPPPGDTVALLGTWTLVLDRPLTSKYEGVAFPDSLHGWVVSDRGEVLHTADGGVTWTLQATLVGHLRSLDFIDANRGFIGTLGGVLYRTLDGGATWTNITSTLPKTPAGFCGIAHFGNTVYVVGRYQSASDFFVSTDGGNSWQYTSVADLAQGLVEVSFISESVGFLGGMANSVTPSQGPATILKTNDGGATWHTVFVHDVTPGWAWKIFPISATLLYASLESHDGSLRVVRSTDGGESWDVQIVATGQNTNLPVQGIGFLDANVGWIGGWFTGMYATTNGGLNWSPVGGTSANVNRFRRAGNTLFTAGTKGILRYDPRH